MPNHWKQLTFFAQYGIMRKVYMPFAPVAQLYRATAS